MTTIKSYTDLQQSKKLAKILPMESADMHYVMVDTENEIYSAGLSNYIGILPSLPCWSLAALLNVLPKYIDGSVLRMDMSENDFNLWFDDLSGIVDILLPDITKDNPIDACIEMILKLHGQKLL